LQPAADVPSQTHVAEGIAGSQCKRPRKRLKLTVSTASQSTVAEGNARPTSQCKELRNNQNKIDDKQANELQQRNIDDKTPCMYCEVAYNESNVKWYMCKNCKGCRKNRAHKIVYM